MCMRRQQPRLLNTMNSDHAYGPANLILKLIKKFNAFVLSLAWLGAWDAQALEKKLPVEALKTFCFILGTGALMTGAVIFSV